MDPEPQPRGPADLKPRDEEKPPGFNLGPSHQGRRYASRRRLTWMRPGWPRLNWIRPRPLPKRFKTRNLLFVFHSLGFDPGWPDSTTMPGIVSDSTPDGQD